MSSMTHEELERRLEALRTLIETTGGKIVIKRGWFWKLLHYAVIFFSAGTNRKFLTNYYTTIGPWIGVPENWEAADLVDIIAVLEHENYHVGQCKRIGLGNVYVGLVPFSFLYLLCLPMGLAYFRWRFEREAYVHGINVKLSLVDPSRFFVTRLRLIDSAVRQLTTGLYAWTWPFPVSVRYYFNRHVVSCLPPTHPNCRSTLEGLPL